jgi:hypothetical protein
MTLNDVIMAITELLKRKENVFEVTYKRVIGDTAECKVLTKYTPEFARATMYTYNSNAMRWSVEMIQNPKQASVG